jgi:hypothetical protein
MFPQVERIPEADLEHQITPYFKHLVVENVPQSEIQGKAVMETKEVVELRFAGDKNYSPVLPVDAMYRKEGHRVITYAERFSEQYAQFVRGAAQEASGTPLEKLSEYGITAAQLSLCRAVKIYNVEALYNLDGANLKSLGLHGNSLKDMAAAYMADRSKGNETARELAELRAEVERLRAAAPLPAQEPTPAEMQEALDAADKEVEAMNESELKAEIKRISGQFPRGTPSHEWLVKTVRELRAA